MTSDLKDLKSFRVSFRLGQPFLPFQQLLGCLPAASSNFLPAPYRKLMTDETSPLIHYYPPVEEIKVDMNGKVRARDTHTRRLAAQQTTRLHRFAPQRVHAPLLPRHTQCRC
jgi:5'-3' exoribonuclease 1